MVRHANNAIDTDASALPEILRSRHLAAILTPLIVQATARLAADFEAAEFGRAMAPSIAAIRSMVTEIRAYHGMAPLDVHPVTGEPLGTDDGWIVPEPEPAEAKS